MNKLCRAVLAAVSAFSLLSCSSIENEISLRATLTQIEQNPLGIAVTVGNGLGMAVTAARVVVTDPEGNALLLPFSNDRQAYVQSIASPASGEYGIFVDLRKGGKEMFLEAPFLSLAACPEISSITDSSGASALGGQAVSAGRDIAVTWPLVDGASLYVVTVIMNGSVAYSSLGETARTVIPAGSLSAGVASVRVEAQAISGDPLLDEQPYFSVCSRQGASVAFTLE